jgi:hypothetical protein
MSPDLLPPPRKRKGSHADGGNPLSHYARWSGLVFQMAAVVVIGYFVGSKADGWLQTEHSPWTLAEVISGVIAAMVLAIRSVLRRPKS